MGPPTRLWRCSLPRITPRQAGSPMKWSTFSFCRRSTQFGMLCRTRERLPLCSSRGGIALRLTHFHIRARPLLNRCRTYSCLCLLTHADRYSWFCLPSRWKLENLTMPQWSTATHNAFRYCRVRFNAFIGQPFSKQLYIIVSVYKTKTGWKKYKYDQKV